VVAKVVTEAITLVLVAQVEAGAVLLVICLVLLELRIKVTLVEQG
jgi:hypothetical protein